MAPFLSYINPDITSARLLARSGGALLLATLLTGCSFDLFGPPRVKTFSVTGVSPDHGPVEGGTTVTITGSGFPSGINAVRIGPYNSLTAIHRVSSSQLTGVTPGTLTTGPVDIAVVVQVPGWWDGYDVTDSGGCRRCFTYDMGNGVSIVSVSPNVGSAEGGTEVTVTVAPIYVPYVVDSIRIGTNLLGNLTRVPTSGVELTGRTSANAAGVVPVVVYSKAYGDGTCADCFMYLTPGSTAPSASLVAGGDHACALRFGNAFCWGANASGQLGDGSTTARNRQTAVTGGVAFTALTAGEAHTCSLTSTGTAYCWGSDAYGQLGDGAADNAPRATPVAVTGATVFTSLTAGGRHTCGLTADSAAWCWGDNTDGQLGDGTTTMRTAPTAVAGGIAFARITAGARHTCGFTSAGAAWCWGSNASGALGDGSAADHSAPGLVGGGITFVSLTAGSGYTCGVASDGAGYCWGVNGFGQLGEASVTTHDLPFKVAGLHKFTIIAAGGDHTCALDSAGVAWCWGDNARGQLGIGSHVVYRSPALVSLGEPMINITSGTSHSCGIAQGVIYCWGRNTDGAVGNGTLSDQPAPTKIVF